MKILMITESLRGGGKERRMIELLKGMDKSDIKIKLILLKNINQYKEVDKIKNLEIEFVTSKFKKDPKIVFQLVKICRTFQPNIIHSWGAMPSIYILPAAIFLRIPLINAMVTNAFVKPLSEKWIRSRLTFPFSRIVLSNSKAGIGAYKVPERKSRVIYNGFNPERLQGMAPEPAIRQLLNLKKPNIIGMVGAFHKRKDYLTFFRAIKKLNNKRNDIDFLAIGDGEGLQKHRDYVQNNAIPNVTFPGRMAKIEEVINTFTIGILTTNNKIHEEGISNSILEYMALGKPVIANKGGGNNEIIEDGYSGFLITPQNENELVEKIDALLNNDTLCKNMGERGREIVKEKFSIGKMVSQTIDLYHSIISEN